MPEPKSEQLLVRWRAQLAVQVAELGQAELDQAELDQAELDQEALGQAELGQVALDQVALDQAELDQAELDQAVLELPSVQGAQGRETEFLASLRHCCCRHLHSQPARPLRRQQNSHSANAVPSAV